MTLEQLIARVREQINARIAQRNTNATELERLRGLPEVDETAVAALRQSQASIDAELEALRAQLEGYEAEQRADAAVTDLQARVGPSGAPAPTNREATTRVGTEPRTYTRESDPQGQTFLRDVAASFVGDLSARERLSRHMAEERVERAETVQRAVSTGGAPGLVVPQYLIELYAPKGRPGRKLADQCRHHDLPETGMTAYIPRQTAKTSVANQATENTAVSEDDYADEMIAVPIRTAAGSQTISRQSVERSLGTEDIVFEDLLKAYDVNLDSTIINAPTWGLLAVANLVTYTDATPTAAELYRKILAAAANVEDVLQDLDEDEVFTLMRGRRWKWLQGELTDQWPFIAAQGFPALAGGTSTGSGYPAGVRGFLPNGGAVVTDNNLPNALGSAEPPDEDVAVAVARQEAHLWEDPNSPMYIRAEQPQAKKLGIDLVVYGYYAACFDRVVDDQGTPKAVHQKITGTGLKAPTF